MGGGCQLSIVEICNYSASQNISLVCWQRCGWGEGDEALETGGSVVEIQFVCQRSLSSRIVT